MYKYILAIMTCLILIKAISSDPVKAAENPEQKKCNKESNNTFERKLNILD